MLQSKLGITYKLLKEDCFKSKGYGSYYKLNSFHLLKNIVLKAKDGTIINEQSSLIIQNKSNKKIDKK